MYIIHSLTDLLKTYKYQKGGFGTKKCIFRDNLKIVLDIIFIGRLLVMYIDFHVYLIANFAIPTFFWFTLYIDVGESC